MLTHRLFTIFTYLGAEWVLWILASLSVVSIAVMLERFTFFRKNSSAELSALIPLLAAGKFDEAKGRLSGQTGMEARVVEAAIDAAPAGPASVEEVIAGVIVRERPPYERFLAFLGTLGNNAPFLGLFGTVVGIIKAFADLALTGGKAAGGPQVVMAGISEALVATAVGIFVAIPAVVAYNSYQRWLRTIVARTNALGHAVIAHLKAE